MTPLEKRRDRSADDRRVRILVGPEDHALADLGDHGALGRNLVERAGQVVGRLARPDVEHHVDAFDEHGVTVAAEIAEHLGIRHQPAGRDPEDEAPLQHVVEHRHLGRHAGGVRIRQVHGARAETDRSGLVGKARKEGDRRGDDLGMVGRVLAAIGLGKAQLLRQEERLAILSNALRDRLVQRVDRHGEKRQFHLALRAALSSLSCRIIHHRQPGGK